MKNAIYFTLFLFTLAGCIEPYHIDIATIDKILVVEGIISSGTTKITLYETVGINDVIYGGNFPAVNAARVYVESEHGAKTPEATSSGQGVYLIKTGELNIDEKYKLVILLAGEEYHSSYLAPAISPPLFLTYNVDDVNIHINITTHGNKNQPGYYLWLYEEDWEITAYVPGRWAMIDGELVPNDLFSPNNRYYCWKSDNSKNLILASTEKLAENSIIEKRLITFSRMNDRASSFYRIKVKQNTIHKEGYDFFNTLKKNTEQTGSIFGAIPSEMQGNIRCVSNPDISVIGYIDVSTSSIGELYIGGEYFNWMSFSVYSVACTDAEVVLPYPNPDLIPRDYILYFSEIIPLAYHYISQKCVDCTLIGGTKKRPVDWPTNHY